MANQNPYIVIEQKDESKRKGWVAGALAICFVALLAVGGTFAYLTWTTNQTPNRFTTDPTVTADLLEPAWTNAATSEDHKASDGTKIPAAADNMLPSSEVAKNPFVVNTSRNGSDIYAGMKLQFQKWVVDTEGGDASGKYVNMTSDEVDTLLACYAFSSSAGSKTKKAGMNTTDNSLGTNWTQINTTMAADYGAAEGKANSNGAMYFYNTEKIKAETDTEAAAETEDGDTWNIPDNAKTSSLFTHVRFIDTATQDQINALNKVLKSASSSTGTNYAKDPGWRVVISGAAIQATSNNNANDFVASSGAESWKTLLDANTETTDSTKTSKPTAATGVRSGKTTLPEASNVKPVVTY